MGVGLGRSIPFARLPHLVAKGSLSSCPSAPLSGLLERSLASLRSWKLASPKMSDSEKDRWIRVFYDQPLSVTSHDFSPLWSHRSTLRVRGEQQGVTTRRQESLGPAWGCGPQCLRGKACVPACLELLELLSILSRHVRQQWANLILHKVFNTV